MKRKHRSSVCALLALSSPVSAYAAPAVDSPVPQASAAQAAPIAGCTEALIGPAYDAVVESSIRTECFQFVTEPSEKAVKLNVVVAGLPADSAHDVHLIKVKADGSTAAAASDATGGIDSLLQVISPPLTRWLLMLGGEGIKPGLSFQFQAEVVENPDRYEPNDTPEHPSVLKGSQRIEATLDSASDVDLYVITVGSEQQTAKVRCAGSVGIVCEALAEGQWVAVPDPGFAEITASLVSPMILRARWKEGSTQAIGSYTLRTSDPRSKTVISSARSSENISHLAPGKETPFPVPDDVTPVPGGANAARQIDVTAVVYDSDGETRVPAGEHVTLYAVDYDLDTKKSALLAQVDGYTDANGELSARLNIGPCLGVGIKGPIRMNQPSYKADSWHITYVPGAHVIALLDDGRSKATISPFQHVCDERYEPYREPRS